MSADANQEQFAWKSRCLSNGWECRICGAIPEIGKHFEGDLCEDCQLSLRNYDPTST